MSKEINYQKDVIIDETALDVEWLEQPALMIKYCEHSCRMDKELDELIEELKVTEAELDKSIREDPTEYGIDKITVDSVKAVIISDKECKRLRKEIINAQFEANMAKKAIQSIETKKKALEQLVALHGQQYFAGPKVPRNISSEWKQRKEQEQAREKEVNAGIANKMKRTK